MIDFTWNTKENQKQSLKEIATQDYKILNLQ